MSVNVIDQIISAGRKVIENNPLLKQRHGLQKNEFLAAIECLIIESLHSEILTKKDKIDAYVSR